MGTTTSYWRLSPEEFVRLQNDPAAVEVFFGLDIDEDDDVSTALV